MSIPFRPVLLAAVAASLPAVPTSAHAHFSLLEPACYSEQSSLGLPEKSAPCGQADPGNPVSETGAVTAVMEGGMLTLTIEEEIFHPGHYRVAIAEDMSSLPDDPPVTAGSSACGSTVIESSPALPLLADGVFEHTARFSGPQTTQIPLPAGFTCDHCVLQVIEFMSNHGLNDPGGCFYHHCATVTVSSEPITDAGTSTQDAGSSALDGGVPPIMDASTSRPDGGTTTGMSAGCGCRVGARSSGIPGSSIVALLLGALLVRRRRS